ncbi:flagellar basal body rod protein FlgB [Paucibacter sp. R3-3]|uniref:Flagellar basal body rod protein FlgB n=1 Tax=Roseateles agri TaxID=3098619 RepID=A0ABU5DNW1_9BURK|nr:flagellar basal body rod protein FlgB [Paucibacter sp. R3-3]MDY0747423.1 flagellar basal body rod protein FlgB [Paucibacter sp. R3-3]
MSIDFTKAVGIHPEALKLRAERTKILASNIANESTPGFQARDMDFASALSERVNADGADGGLSLDTGDDALKYRVPFHPAQDGSTVELGVEQAQFSQNASDFSTSLQFINIQLKGLAKAINGQ